MPNRKKATKSSATVDRATFRAIVEKLRATVRQRPGTTCWFSSLKVNGRGHVQIKYDRIKYLGHRIMACVSNGDYVPYDKLTKIEASHLCGNAACINPRHLHLENCLINQTRDCCRMFRNTVGYHCPHQPACIGCVQVGQ